MSYMDVIMATIGIGTPGFVLIKITMLGLVVTVLGWILVNKPYYKTFMETAGQYLVIWYVLGVLVLAIAGVFKICGVTGLDGLINFFKG